MTLLLTVRSHSYSVRIWTTFGWMQGLERNPLAIVPLEPTELLDKTRYQLCQHLLTDEKQARLQVVLAQIASTASKRGVLVKPFFDDPSRDCNSVRRINHITPQQFKQV
jgi:hypothetical protein